MLFLSLSLSLSLSSDIIIDETFWSHKKVGGSSTNSEPIPITSTLKEVKLLIMVIAFGLELTKNTRSNQVENVELPNAYWSQEPR